jgi:Uma2 family endonuclease
MTTMLIEEKSCTAADFEQIAALPENRERRLEYIGGEVIEVVSNNEASRVAASILAEIRMFIKGRALGWVTGADGGYVVSGERYIPDVGFISRQRQPDPCRETWNPLSPDLAVEVMSPTDSQRDMTIKIANYLAASTIVWLVQIPERRVLVFVPGQPVIQVGDSGVLTGGTLLPDFQLALKDVFEG